MKPSPTDRRRNRRRSIGWPPGEQDVIDAVTRLRESGEIPWDWIADEERQLTVWAYSESVAAYLLERLTRARIDAWAPLEPPLILCESKGTAAALRSVAGGYLAPIAGVRGMANGFLRTQIAPLLDDSDVRHVLYLGDLDVSGEHIEANTRHVLERASECALLWSRIGITQAQVAELGITPIHKVDGRGKAKLAHLAYEVESLGQTRVIALVRDALEALLPEPLERVQGREDEQIAAARRLLAGGTR